MSIWEVRGQQFLRVILALMGATYLAERAVYHAVVGLDGLLTSFVIIAILGGLGWLIYRGHGWLRWLVAAFFILNGLGAPSGMAAVFGTVPALLIALALLAAHSACAIALCFTPGLPAFLRYQRAQSKRPSARPTGM